MHIDDVMSALRDAGTPQNLATYARHGVKSPAFGVSTASKRALARRIKKDQPLAETLWATQNHDARILATFVADPGQISGRVLAAWIDDIDCGPLTDAVSAVAAGHPSALALAAGWRASSRAWTSCVGWQVLALHVPQSEETTLGPLVAVIEKRIAAAPACTQEAMNAVLVAIGARGDRLCTLAIEGGRRIGAVSRSVEAQILKLLAKKAAPSVQRKPPKKRVKARPSVTARALRATRGA